MRSNRAEINRQSRLRVVGKAKKARSKLSSFSGLSAEGVRMPVGLKVILSPAIPGDLHSRPTKSGEEPVKSVASLNDSFRALAGLRLIGGQKLPGMISLTRGIATFSPVVQRSVLEKVRVYQSFTKENDPWGEHDCGWFDVIGIGEIFWAIDCFADSRCEEDSPDPTDPSRCYRVLTVTLACEY
jgi:hypothetical protein